MRDTDIRVRRVYEESSPEDGVRVLVDRIWPRGLRKDAARLDEWAKDVAPSTELRTWYGHDPAKFDEFKRRYTAELDEPGAQQALSRLRALAADRPLTLLTATKDLDLSQAAVLAGLLRDMPPDVGVSGLYQQAHHSQTVLAAAMGTCNVSVITVINP